MSADSVNHHGFLLDNGSCELESLARGPIGAGTGIGSSELGKTVRAAGTASECPVGKVEDE